MAHLGTQYRVLGEFGVFDAGGDRLPVSGRQATLLAILLAGHPESVTPGRLVEEIWAGSPTKDPESALHNAVSRLRNAVGNDLVTTPVGYSIAPGSLDSAHFDDAIETARVSGSLEDYEAAIRLWAGQPYVGFEDQPSVALEIERLKQSHRRASQEWHRLLLEHGRADEAAEKLKLSVTADPLDESALGLYMRALDASGRKPEALKVFRDYERRLGEETGLEPSLAIRELEVSILVDELDPPERESRPPVRLDLAISYFVRAAGEQVAVGRAGTGPDLFVHPGWLSALDVISAGMDMRTPTWAELAKTHQLIIFDRYGTGLSRGEPQDTSFATSVEELKTLLRQTTSGPVPVWAASGAGPICIQAAVEAPELISHLILLGTYASGPKTFSKAAADSITSLVRASWGVGSDVLAQMLFPGASAEVLNAFARSQKDATTPDLAARLLTQLYQADVSSVLGQVGVPCLVIHYQGDKGIPVSGGEHLARDIPGARFVVLEGISHYPSPGQERKVVDMVDEFISQTAL